MADRPAEELAEEGTLLVEQRFAIVPEWIIDAAVSDCAYRLYSVLVRYGQSSGTRMPSRVTLAARLRKSSVDTVDRAMRELVALGAVSVRPRYAGPVRLTNRYVLHHLPPGSLAGQCAAAAEHPRAARSYPPSVAAGGDGASHRTQGGGRKSAATPGRISAAGVAASVRPNPEQLTQKEPPPPTPPDRRGERVQRAPEEGIDRPGAGTGDLAALAARCQALRRELGQPTTRWAAPCLSAALALARIRGWPVELAETALLAVAADPATRSPMRLAEAGPWWDAAGTGDGGTGELAEAEELAALDARLDALDGARVGLQARARSQLAAAGEPVTRATVPRGAVALLEADEADR